MRTSTLTNISQAVDAMLWWALRTPLNALRKRIGLKAIWPGQGGRRLLRDLKVCYISDIKN